MIVNYLAVIVATLAAIITGMVLVLANFISTDDMTKSLTTAFLLWLGLVATISLGSVLWENKPVKLYLLNSAYWLVTMLVMALILGV